MIRYPNDRMLQLAEEIRLMRQWLTRFTPPIGKMSMWCDRELYPKDASKKFLEWLSDNFQYEDHVGILMVMRHAQIGHAIFLHLDDDYIADWWSIIREPLAHAMGGRMGEGHSGRARSKFPVED